MTVKRKSMDGWIREALTDPDKDGRISMLSLVHMQGTQQKEIHTTKFSGGRSWTETELANMFRGKAETYAQDLPGVQTFQLLAFYGEKGAPEAYFPFIVNNVGDNSGLMTEAPTEQGRMQQVMRQNEMLIQQVYRRQQVMDDFNIRMMSMQAGMIETLQRENRDHFTIMKEMLMEKALDMHKHKMDQLEFERSTTERKKWLSFAPALINTILGREVFPQGMADTALVETIADNLKEEDISKLAGVLPPQLLGPLVSRFVEYEKKKNSEQEHIKALSAMKSPDPEADAAGDAVSNGLARRN